jgi:GAF domain
MTDPGRVPSAPAARYLAARRLIDAERPADGAGVVGALQRLCRALTAHLEVLGVAVSLASSSGPAVVAASDARSQRLDEIQFTTGEGPCFDAVRLARPVLTPDLAADGARQWPGYADTAVGGGVKGVFAFPLQAGATCVGVLDVFRSRKGSMAEESLAMALTFARIATEILLDGEPVRNGGLERGLGDALDRRAEIYQAQGVVMVALELDAAEALARMRAHAFARDATLFALALEILNGEVDLGGG